MLFLSFICLSSVWFVDTMLSKLSQIFFFIITVDCYQFLRSKVDLIFQSYDLTLGDKTCSASQLVKFITVGFWIQSGLALVLVQLERNCES